MISAGRDAFHAPDDLRPAVLDAAVAAPSYWTPEPDNLDMAPVREAIRRRIKPRIAYRDAVGAATERTIWPIMVACFETVRMVVAWCETRQAFRHFRTDRVVEMAFLEERFTPTLAALRKGVASAGDGGVRVDGKRRRCGVALQSAPPP